MPKRRGAPVKIYGDNDTGGLLLVFFNKIHPFIFNKLRVGSKVVVSGKVELNDFYHQISHPDIILDRKHLGFGIEPVYPLTYGITNKQLSGYVSKVLEIAKSEPSHDKKLLDALIGIHSPKNVRDVEMHLKTLARLELMANQISLAKIRQKSCAEPGSSFSKAARLQEATLSRLGFTLSQGQEQVLKEIESDQVANSRMTRMLQGDVGSGKTLVALMTMLNVAQTGSQSALMAPTDLLATQHYALFSRALDGVARVALLTGKTKSKERTEILKSLESGEILVLIGTHALFQNNVNFNNLGYIIIDEQHRFGVQQRLELVAKGNNPDLLVMTATPIPRSLTLTLFGDMSVSRLTTKPEMRPEIATSVMRVSKINDVIAGIERKLAAFQRVYWVCPLIEQEEEAQDFSDVVSRWAALNNIYPNKVGLLHGKMLNETKDEVMQRFKSGDLDILVATTVIEVGIDVPEATLIVIENAERFGLSQRHQHRGRVGRGMTQSHCVLLYDKAGEVARNRMEIMRTSNDGFYIAEQDLKLRGGGEILGLKQSGQEEFRFADLVRDIELVIECHKAANTLASSDDLNYAIKIFDRGLVEKGFG